MIKYVYSPLNLEGMEYNQYGFIVITDKEAFVRSLAPKVETISLDDLLFEADDRNEMAKAIEEAKELINQEEIFV